MMPKQRSPDRDKAKELYLQQKGEIPLIEIANQLNLSEGTVRGWKAKDAWDDELNGMFQSNIKKNTERSKQDTERSDKNRKKPSIKYSDKKVSGEKPDKADSKTDTNSPSPFARYGNQNAKGNKGGPGGPVGNQYAVGNRGGLGGPIRNKKALKTGEFETVFFTADILDDEERALLDADYDKYIMQYLLIDTLNIREKRILKRIKEVENTPGGMVYESVTKNKGTQATKFVNRNKDGEQWDGNDMILSQDNSAHVAKPVLKRVMELEDALTRVQGRKQAAIAQLHRMEMDDERLSIDYAKLEIYKQRISGRVDLDALFDADEFGLDLELDLED